MHGHAPMRAHVMPRGPIVPVGSASAIANIARSIEPPSVASIQPRYASVPRMPTIFYDVVRRVDMRQPSGRAAPERVASGIPLSMPTRIDIFLAMSKTSPCVIGFP